MSRHAARRAVLAGIATAVVGGALAAVFLIGDPVGEQQMWASVGSRVEIVLGSIILAIVSLTWLIARRSAIALGILVFAIAFPISAIGVAGLVHP